MERFERLTWERGARVKEEGRFAPPVERLYLSEKKWQEGLSSFPQVHSESLDVIPPGKKSFDSFLTVKSYLNTDLHHEISSHQGKEASLAPLVERLNTWEGERIILVASTSADATRLRDLLAY